MLPSLDNFVSFGVDVFKARPDYCQMILDIYQTSITSDHLGENDAVNGCKLAESMLLNLRGAIDDALQPIIATALPVIGKADSMTLTEKQEFKKRIMEDIEHYGIPVYNFPYDVEEDDEETIADNSELRGLASQREYVQKEFNEESEEDRIRLTRGMIVDFAMLSGLWAWEGELVPGATICTLT